MAESKFACTNDGNNYGKISSLFFDLDNTLIPTRVGDSKAIKKLADVLEIQFGLTKDESTCASQSFLKSFRRCPDNSQTSLDSWRTYLWREALPARYKHLAEKIYPKWLQLRYRFLAIPPDYVRILQSLRALGKKLALITNGPSNAQWEKIKKLNISQHFDCVLVSGDLPWEKPNANIFLAACNYLGVKPAECAMIGDKLESDIKGGRLAGLGATFWIPLCSVSEDDLDDVAYRPHAVLKNLSELCKYYPGLGVAMNSNTSGLNSLISTSSSFQLRRRFSQISRSTTTSTCDSDLYNYPQHYQHNQHQYKNRYRRGGSLPAIELINSETENSSDSLFG